MAPSAAQFIATAFAGSGPFSLCYPDHKCKRLIISHLLSLFNEFPSLSPRASHFTTDDGATFYLLVATGTIAATPLTIWLLPTYPSGPPLVYVSQTAAAAITEDHPFVNSATRAVFTPYLLTWCHRRANLVGLVRNLQRVFHLYSPLLPTTTTNDSAATTTTGFSLSLPSHVSKQEAIDRLALALIYDISGFRRQVIAETNDLLNQRSDLEDRRKRLEDGIKELEHENLRLEERMGLMNSQIHSLQKWLEERKEVRSGEMEVEKIFECVDRKSRVVLESSAADLAIEDVMQKLDRALQEGLVELSVYMKLVRSLAREQFYCIVDCTKILQPQN
ncbi:protein ELC-like [Nymphaea colorata]|nr:protein ELC-like [Nymphaea colorata]